MNLTAYGSELYGQAAAEQALDALRAIGGTDVNIVVTWYMDTQESSEIAAQPLKSPSDASLLSIMSAAHARGLRVALKPHVDALDGTFRGRIRPRDRAAWYESYSAFVTQTAQLAEQARAERFIVGTELTSMARDAAAFGTVIDAAREIYSGRMTYAANWVQEAETVDFWDQLDEIGIDAYMPLTQQNQPDVPTLVKAWGQWTKRMDALHAKTGKPLIFTELGYPARSNAPARPAVELASQPVDPAQQQRLYEAAMLALRPLDYFSGALWWDWPADGLPSPGGYTPRGEPAGAVLQRFWARPDLPGATGASGPSGASGAS